jgi:hypothetical protein
VTLSSSVMSRAVIPASRDEVWALISAERHLERAHPFVERHVTYRWCGAGSADGLLYRNGLVVRRDFHEWREGLGYELTIGVKQRRSTTVSWTLADHPAGCTLEISLRSDLEGVLGFLAAERREAAWESFQGPAMALYLDSVTKGVAHVVTTGTDVRPNQFGAHPLFSAPSDDVALPLGGHARRRSERT